MVAAATSVATSTASAVASKAATSVAAKAATSTASVIATDPAEASAHLVKRFYMRKDDFIAAISSTDFYIELFFIGLAIMVALMATLSIQGYVRKRLLKHPSKFFDADFAIQWISLLTPLFAILLLTADKLISLSLDVSSGWVDAASQLCMAYLEAKAVLLAVRSRPVAILVAFAILVQALLHALRIWKSTTTFLESIAVDVGSYHLTLLNFLHGAVIFVVVFWVAGVLSRTLETYLRRSSAMSYNARELTVKVFRIICYFTALVVTLSAAGIDLTAFAVFGGALGVGVGLGLQKLTSNFVSSVTLLMEKSIKIGDLIEIGGYTGWVRQLNIRYALLETFDGREIMIPNENMVSTNLTNWTHTTTRASVEIKVTIDFKSDPVKAHELMLEAANENPSCIREPAPSCYMREFTDHGFLFTLTFWISDIKKGRNKPQSEVMFAIVDKFRQAGIGLAHL